MKDVLLLDNVNKKIYFNNELTIQKIVGEVIDFLREKLYGKITVTFMAGKITCVKKETTVV